MTILLVVLLVLLLGILVYRRKRQSLSTARADAEARAVPLTLRLSALPPPSPASQRARRAPEAAATGDPQAKAPASDASSVTRSRRRSDRVPIKIPIEVSGKDAAGNSFREQTHTLAVNRNGASIGLTNSPQLKEEITVKNLQTGQTCRFQACRVYTLRPEGFREWALECLDPSPDFWRISFPEVLEESSSDECVSCLLECTVCQYREMTRLSLAEYQTIEKTSLPRNCVWCGERTEWGFAVIGGGERSSLSSQDWGEAVSVSSGLELRREDRRIVQLPIVIRHADGREESTTTEDVSRSGLCCTANIELSGGERVVLRRPAEGTSGEPEFRGQVIWRREINEKRKFLYGMKVGPAGSEVFDQPRSVSRAVDSTS